VGYSVIHWDILLHFFILFQYHQFFSELSFRSVVDAGGSLIEKVGKFLSENPDIRTMIVVTGCAYIVYWTGLLVIRFLRNGQNIDYRSKAGIAIIAFNVI
jgi:hypothetical protein